MRKHWLAMVAISLSMGACDDVVNVDCGEDGCQFSDGECQDNQTRCLAEGIGVLKCKDGFWQDIELCSVTQSCNPQTNQCEETCDGDTFECNPEESDVAYHKCQEGRWITGTCQEGEICQNNECTPKIPVECQGSEYECTDKSNYHKCVNNHWENGTCDADQICQDGICIPKVQEDCNTDSPECIVASNIAYRECINHKWEYKTCEDGLFCENGICSPKKPGECEDGQKRCVANTDSQYEECQNGQWIADFCEDGFICQDDGNCVPQKTEDCKKGQRRCVANDAHQYEECQNSQWIADHCEDGFTCQGDGNCVPQPPEDCEEGKFLRCIENNTKKVVQTCSSQKEIIEPCAINQICSTEEKDCKDNTPPPPDSCASEKISEELSQAMAECDEPKTFIVSSSTLLSQLNNWYEDGKKSCLVFCGDIALDGLTKSIPLPDNAKVVGVNHAKLHANELSVPLFMPQDNNKEKAAIISNTFKNLSIAVTKFLISEDGAHAILANNAETATVENVSLSGTLTHTNNQYIKCVGGLFSKTSKKTTITNAVLKDVKIQLENPSNYNDSNNYSKSVAGFIGEASGDVEITGSQINGLTIQAGYARHVGGMVGKATSNVSISGSFQFNKEHIQYDITNYDVSKLTISNAVYYAGGLIGRAENASLTVNNMAIQIDTIQSYLKGAAGIAGDIRRSDNGNKPELVINSLYLKVSNQIKAGECAGGIAGTLKESSKLDVQNVISKISKIDAIQQSEFTYGNPDGNKAGGLFGIIEEHQSEGIIQNVYQIASHIQSSKYAGGFIGELDDNNNNIFKFADDSNFVKEIIASENIGGLVGFVQDNNTININKLQNMVLTLNLTNNNTYSGGVIGKLNNNSTIDKIKLNTVISYSQRNRNTSRQDEGALISSNQCKNTDGPFTTTLYINDIKVDYNYNATACINSIQGNTTGRLRRIWGENDCNNSKADGFTCTKVKVKDNKDPIFIPLFDTAMIKDNAIQW